jgi:Uma2 family endonuclease
MVANVASYVVLPHYLSSDEDEGQSILAIPNDVHTLAGFRRWVHSKAFPEKLRAHFIRGNVYVDMSQQELQTHVLVKSAIFGVLPALVVEDDLGEFYPEGPLLTNKVANISTNPDGLAILWETIEARRVRFVKTRAGETEIQGSPDWILEVISRSSVRKDKKDLRLAYHVAKIPEYWLVDARGENIDFQIVEWRKNGYLPVAVDGGWQASRVFGREFQLVRKRNRRGAWQYTLLVR